MNETNDETDAEFDFLVTRAHFHIRCQKEIHAGKGTSSRKTNYLTKFILCAKHKDCETPDKDVRTCETCFVLPVQEYLPNGRLPVTEQVLGYLYYQTEQNKQLGLLGQSSTRDVAGDLLCHWINCNIYTKTLKVVLEDLKTVDETFKKMKRYPKKKKNAKKEDNAFDKNLKAFKSDCGKLFDIRTKDTHRQKQLGSVYNVTETKKEEDFYKGQCKVPQVRVFFRYEYKL